MNEGFKNLRKDSQLILFTAKPLISGDLN